MVKPTLRRIEILADAIANRKGGWLPWSHLYKLRNPGGLRNQFPDSPKYGQLRSFNKWVSGYDALTYDLEEKCKGGGYSGLQFDTPLIELLRVFDLDDEDAFVVKVFLQTAGLADVTLTTPISYFL